MKTIKEFNLFKTIFWESASHFAEEIVLRGDRLQWDAEHPHDLMLERKKIVVEGIWQMDEMHSCTWYKEWVNSWEAMFHQIYVSTYIQKHPGEFTQSVLLAMSLAPCEMHVERTGEERRGWQRLNTDNTKKHYNGQTHKDPVLSIFSRVVLIPPLPHLEDGFITPGVPKLQYKSSLILTTRCILLHLMNKDTFEKQRITIVLWNTSPTSLSLRFKESFECGKVHQVYARPNVPSH